jgi:hypothetical protein
MYSNCAPSALRAGINNFSLSFADTKTPASKKQQGKAYILRKNTLLLADKMERWSIKQKMAPNANQ